MNKGRIMWETGRRLVELKKEMIVDKVVRIIWSQTVEDPEY